MTDSSTTRTQTLVGIDNEIRFGLSPRSDLGVRVPNLSGIVVMYKQRIDRTEELAEDGGGRVPSNSLYGLRFRDLFY